MKVSLSAQAPVLWLPPARGRQTSDAVPAFTPSYMTPCAIVHPLIFTLDPHSGLAVFRGQTPLGEISRSGEN
ncbi:hypothetical protein CTA1_9275 [Colletotrichum tanaceti]|uniref:Uncharacterized protein n=1 Tax=Colletotrichum tanaceti TaxID=1306861 RepID=A0A4U6WZA3_9PEZI|nr:hypothetical protein CTA1_9275 [Colletotrichum tanaceti]